MKRILALLTAVLVASATSTQSLAYCICNDPECENYDWYNEWENGDYNWDYDYDWDYDGVIDYTRYDEFYATYGQKKKADVFYQGSFIDFEDVYPLVENGTTFVPIRKVSELFGCEVEYIAKTDEVLITRTRDDVEMLFKIGSNEVLLNGEVVTLLADTFKLEDRTMVPLRLISEAFGLEVFWNQEKKQVSIVDVQEYKSLDFTVANKVIDFVNVNIEENLEFTGSFKLDMSMFENNENLNFSIDTLFDGLLTATGDGLELSFESNNDLEILKESAYENYLFFLENPEYGWFTEEYTALDEYEQSVMVYEFLENLAFEYIVNVKEMTAYVKVSGLDKLPIENAELFTSSPWIKIDLKEVFGFEESDFIVEMQSVQTIEDYIDLEIETKNSRLYKPYSVWDYNDSFYLLYENLLLIESSNFTKTDVGYELKYNDVDVVFKTNSNDEIESYKATASIYEEWYGDVNTIEFEMGQNSALNLYLNFDMTSAYTNYYDEVEEFNISIALDLDMKETGKEFIGKPTSGTIIDYKDIIEFFN